MSESPPSTGRPRLKFIDLARSIAILLMLEGHFVGLTLDPAYRDPNYPLYIVWNFIRGFTAPLFFTVAGMIFVYLLSGETERRFFRRERVRKGLRRSAQLLFWGYALQFTATYLPKYLRGEFENWIVAFHVLQCIGVGLLAMILIAALHGVLRKIPLSLCYAGAMLLCLEFYMWLEHLPEEMFVPAGWPEMIQNAIRGPRSVFPLAPWLAFTFLGGTMGALVRKHHAKLATPRSSLWFFALAALLKLAWVGVLFLPGLDDSSRDGLAWFTGRAAEVVAFLAVLRWVETARGIHIPWLMRAGVQTFPIYIVHVIILYGGIFGMGLNRWFTERLGPWQAAIGAALFLGFFIGLAQLLDARARRGHIHA